MNCDITKIKQEQATVINDTRRPLGLFYSLNDRRYTGIDNTTGQAWTEDFSNLRQCKRWLMNPSIMNE